jgi:hypothetical protein
MKRSQLLLTSMMLLTVIPPMLAQQSSNCFLVDYYPKYIAAPVSRDMAKTASTPTVTVTLNGTDTLGKVSNYLFGNAAAVWVGQDVNNPTLVNHLQVLSPTLIRFPGGSWSDIYFWNGNPGDLPDTAYSYNTNSSTWTKGRFYPQIGSWYSLTVDRYYDLRSQLGCQGLITVNYAYARYGKSANPVAQAAHYAADWVRYDQGRTAFWEIGNENAGPWEAGWRIDHSTSPDGQPDTITGELYGRHFKVFVDSMKAAAAQVGTTIYVGGQILHFDGTNDWDVANRKWNEGFFREVGDSADFYVMHNYFGNSATTIKNQVNNARTAIDQNIAFIRQDIVNKQASSKPVAITEWNCGGPDAAKTSTANGLQAVVLLGEMMNNNFGMSARWLIANYESDGMFYSGSNTGIPLWNPRPDFYYVSYMQRFIGDHVISVSAGLSNDILPYATRYTSGHTSVVIVNKGTVAHVVKIVPGSIGVGDKYYVHTLAGIDNSQWPQSVVINGYPPTAAPWGPLDSLANIPAWAYPIENEIKVESPAGSVEFVLIDNGSRDITAVDVLGRQIVEHYKLQQNFPNPFNPSTTISYSLPKTSTVTLKVYDLLGRAVATLLNGKTQSPGNYEVKFDGTNLSSGVYLYSIQTEGYRETRTMVLVK